MNSSKGKRIAIEFDGISFSEVELAGAEIKAWQHVIVQGGSVVLVQPYRDGDVTSVVS